MASAMKEANKLRTALESGSGPVFGGWQQLPGANLSRIIARAGYDWVCIDCEHGNIADGDMHEAVPAIASCGVSPVVRIVDKQDWMVKRALDAGAHGIIIPLSESVKDVERVVAATKFPPLGQRGFGSPFSMGPFDGRGSLSGYDYMTSANANLLTIIQIETRGALDAVQEIAKLDGVDVLLVGPWDLGNNLGHPVKGDFDPELESAIATIRDAAKRAGKKSGIVCPNAEFCRKYVELGFEMIAVTTDVGLLTVCLSEALAKVKGSNTASQPAQGVAYNIAKQKL